MREAVARLWPEIQWIENATLREQVTQTWVKALERSPLALSGLPRQSNTSAMRIQAL